MSIIITLDPGIDAGYIRLSADEVADTIEFNEQILVDVDEFGVAVGIELLEQSAALPFAELVSQFHVHSDVVDLLRLIRPDLESFLTVSQGTDGVSTGIKDRRLMPA
ncbi:DUF2283 domain-containing protein [Nocardioides bruguierae]|uniref:DUF2283 domain-containing protein n=1 Tax=Nocardioides bruguierae TaxID=2945102 RepID=A0A9X2D488_9ACTN|nr:DUF2283 domain-containing protein [Nocardioides bruguierae]MCM0618755.1 DUF2283 domain-containing protein [Nocardioides bruguierae]